MVTGAAEASTGDLRALFAAPVRWGWEFVPAPPALLSPERSNPPSARAPRYISQQRAARLPQIAMITTAAAIGVVWFDAQMGLFNRTATGARGSLLTLGHLVAAAAFLWFGTRAWIRSGSPHQPTSVFRWLLVLGGVVVTVLVPYLVLPVVALLAWLQLLRTRGLVPDPHDVVRAQAEHEEAVAAWQQRIVQFEADEQRRAQTVDLWYPVVPSPKAQTCCVFGGSEISWAAALTTFGASLLGTGCRIKVLDLTRRRATDVLVRLAEEYQAGAAQVQLPADPGAGGLMEGLTWEDLSTLLVEILYSAHESVEASRQGRFDDRAILREVAECLEPSRPVSFGRLRQALLVVQGSQGGRDDAIGDAEFDRLARLYNEVQRQHGGVMERVTRIERVLRGFERFGAAGAGSLVGPGIDQSAPQLQVIGIDKRLDSLDHDHLVDLVFQLVSRRLRARSLDADALVILGADRIRRAALESMAELAVMDRMKIILFFEHLREDAIQLIGGGGAAAAFFALGNHHEAKEASDFIGAGYKWVESQHTRSEGESLNRSWGVEAGTSTQATHNSPMGGSVSMGSSMGTSYSSSFGRSTEYATSEQRVREALVDPEVIQGLPPTGMIWIDAGEKGRRTVANVDCHPQLTFAPRVSRQPRLIPAHG